MICHIENLASEKVLILLNNNSLLPLGPKETAAALPVEEIRNNFVVQKLEEWGLIAVRLVETAGLPDLSIIH